MNTKIILEYFRKINLRLWIFLGIGLLLLIFIIIFAVIKNTGLGLISYVLIIFFLNTCLSIYSVSKNDFIPYLFGVITILVEIFGLILILNI